ncbi:MAG: molybdate ABC transporter substrate-binding protein [Pirellulaceae bacterium]
MLSPCSMFAIQSHALLTLCLSLMIAASAGCASTESDKTLTVFAATSTIDVMTELLSEFEQGRDQNVRTSYGSSSSLASMILQGVQVDLFLSANVDWANRVEEALRSRGVDCEGVDLLSNRLVLVVHEDHTRSPLVDDALRSLKDLPSAGFNKIAVADMASVPAGIYAKRALQNAEVWEEIQGRLVTAADVRGALALVELGAAEAAIVYATDAAASSIVRVEMKIPDSEQPDIRYRIVSVADPTQKMREADLLCFIESPAAAEVFRRHGFVPLLTGSTD